MVTSVMPEVVVPRQPAPGGLEGGAGGRGSGDGGGIGGDGVG